MKRLAFISIFLVLCWAGYWFVGARALEAAFTGWFSERRTAGWQADYSDVSVAGFPYRFDTTLTQPALADPATGWAWRAPYLQLLSLSYQPNHIIAALPPSQSLQTPIDSFTLASNSARASLVLTPSTSLAVDRTTTVIEAPVLTAATGWGLQARQLRLAARVLDDAPSTYQIGLNVGDLKSLDGSNGMPGGIGQIDADVTVKFSAPWDRHAIEKARPQPHSIQIFKADVTWGQMVLKLAGTLTIDTLGNPTGDLAIKATNWREILALGVANGAIPQSMERSLTRGLELVSGLSGSSKTLDVPLTFRRGTIHLGPIPIAPAPNFKIR
jgi:hypothetical protein